MTSTEQLRQLLKNAIEEGFSAEDIEDLARDIEIEQEIKAEDEEYIDELQLTAAEALTDFLFEIGYFEEDADIDDCVQSIDNSLQLVREGNLKVSIKDNTKSCSCHCSKESDVEKVIKILNKFF